MEKVIKLHEKLIGIYQIAKNLHWFSRFYSDHLLFDRIADGILDDDDALIELFLMDELFISIPAQPGYSTDIKRGELYNLLLSSIDDAVRLCDESKTSSIYGGAGSLLDGIQEHLLVKKNLLQQVIDYGDS